MVSEDSCKNISILLSIHGACDSSRGNETFPLKMFLLLHRTHAFGELVEVLSFRCSQLIPFKERNNDAQQVCPFPHNISIKVFRVVVISCVDYHASHLKESLQLIEACFAARALRNSELMEYLIARSVASPQPSRFFPIWLSDEVDGKATLSIYKTDYPSHIFCKTFLLVVCTRHIFTSTHRQ